MDISQGELSHTWEVNGEGIYFLIGEMGWGEVDYESLIDHSASNVTSDKTIHLYFTQPGQHHVRLRNTFAKQVSYTYTEKVDGIDARRTVYGKEEGGIFVIDTTFVVDVYDPVLVPMAKVYRDPECTQEVETGINEDGSYKQVRIEYGDKLYFKDTSYDRPNVWNWSCKQAAVEAEGENVALEFKKIAGEDAPLNVILKIQREAVPTNKYVPTAVAQSAVIPLDIIVEPSTKPLIYDIKQLNATTIQILLGNAEFVPAKIAGVALEKLHFRYENDYKGAALVTGSVTVESIAVDTKPSVLNITLAENLYNTDRMYFYCDLLEDVTIDGRGLEIAESTEPNVVTTYAEYFNESFEDVATENDWYMCEANNINGTNWCEYKFGVDNPVKDGINVSAKCFYVDAGTNDGSGVVSDALRSKQFDGGTETYTFRCKFMIAGIPKSGLTPFFVVPDKGTQDKTWADNIPWINLPNYTKGIWYQVEGRITGKKEAEGVSLAMRFNVFNDKIYFDDFYLGNEEVRPRE